MIKLLLVRLIRQAPDRLVELTLSGALASVAVVQLYTSVSNNRGSTQQTEQLIGAARYSAYAANRNAEAASAFAVAADGINRGISDAVGKLQAETNATDAARESSEAASRESLRATIEDFKNDLRAWVGVDAAYSIPKSIAANQSIFISISFRNTGRTPARAISVAERGEFLPRGTAPDFTYGAPATYGLLPPNGVNHVTISLANEYSGGQLKPSTLSIASMQALSEGKIVYYVHGEGTYQDIYNGLHWFTYCFFLEDLPGPVNFGACQAHNDAGDGVIPLTVARTGVAWPAP